MRRRILFVDDDPHVLQGLQRMLRNRRSEWDMVFVDSGAAALARMAGEPFDVVVSDMRMPGMNGAQLLNEVMRRHPQTARLILSGHADQELILKCVGSTHQYLSKPCDPESLLHAVQRASSVDSALQDENLKRLVASLDQVPSVPVLYSRLLDLLQDPEVELGEVAKVVEQDPGMTAKILKLVNSAFFGCRREISSTNEAVAFLGVDTIKSLALSVNAFAQFEGQSLGGFALEQLWRHSLKVAVIAKGIALAEQDDRKLADEAFVSGLLHDVGKLVLAANKPNDYRQVAARSTGARCPLLEAEIEVFGANHADVGGYLLGLWGLPIPVVEAIALHHAPARSISQVWSPLTAVHVANALAFELAPDPGGWSGPLDVEYLAGLGVADHIPAWCGIAAEAVRNGGAL